MFSTIIGSLVSLFQVIPAVRDIINLFVKEWTKYENKKLQDSLDAANADVDKRVRDAVSNGISEVGRSSTVQGSSKGSPGLDNGSPEGSKLLGK